MTKIEMIERKLEQGRKHQIMDQAFLEKVSADRSAQEAKSAKIMAWVSLGVSIVGTVAAIIALLK